MFFGKMTYCRHHEDLIVRCSTRLLLQLVRVAKRVTKRVTNRVTQKQPKSLLVFRGGQKSA